MELEHRHQLSAKTGSHQTTNAGSDGRTQCIIVDSARMFSVQLPAAASVDDARMGACLDPSNCSSPTHLVNLVALAGAAATKSDGSGLPGTLTSTNSFDGRNKSTEYEHRAVVVLATEDERNDVTHVSAAALAQRGTSRSLPTTGKTGKTKGDYQKKYRSTEKGRAAQRKAQEKYRRSDKGKLAQMRARRKWRENHPGQVHS